MPAPPRRRLHWQTSAPFGRQAKTEHVEGVVPALFEHAAAASEVVTGGTGKRSEHPTYCN